MPHAVLNFGLRSVINWNQIVIFRVGSTLVFMSSLDYDRLQFCEKDLQKLYVKYYCV